MTFQRRRQTNFRDETETIKSKFLVPSPGIDPSACEADSDVFFARQFRDLILFSQYQLFNKPVKFPHLVVNEVLSSGHLLISLSLLSEGT